MRNTFADTMLEVGMVDQKLVVLVGDISHFALQPFAKACPGRFYNVGILEPTIVNMAAGLSIAGLHPVVHTIAPFLIERSVEQIKLDFCYQRVGGTMISVGSAFDYSGLGCSHHCYNDLALIKSLPNTEVVYPASPKEFRRLFVESYRNERLTYFRLPGAQHGVEFRDEDIRMGKGILVKAGRHVTILAAGPQLKTVMESLPLLAQRGIDAEVLYLPMLKPFDQEIVRDSVSRTRRLLVVEEHSRYGGFGDEALRVAVEVADVRCAFVSIPDEFQRGYGHYEDHLQALGFVATNIVAKCSGLLAKGATT